MIQLIGFLVSVYMFMRGLDVLSRAEDRKSGNSRALANAAAWIGIIGGLIFFFLFIVQGNSTPTLPSTSPY